MRSRFTDAAAVSLSLAALLFLFSGHLKLDKLAVPRLSPIAPLDGAPLLVSQEGFAENAVYTNVAPPRIGRDLKRYGSWVGGDFSTGQAQTAWFPSVSTFSLQLAGYPTSHGCEVYVEAATADGAVKRIPMPGNDPLESWQVRDIYLPAAEHFARFRIVAGDRSTGPSGWVGFSQPFRFVHSTAELWKNLAQLLLVALTAAAALVALLFPGLWLRRLSSLKANTASSRAATGKERSTDLSPTHCSTEDVPRPVLPFLWIPLPGFLLLALTGLLCWVGPHALSPRRISQLFLGPLFAYAIYHSLRFPLTTYISQTERRVLLVVLLLATLSLSKASYSLGPPGELFAGQISRTLEVGDRSDSRIPYHVLQLISQRSPADGPLAQVLFGSWGFGARTPLTAFSAAPVVLALPFNIPQALPEQIWTVFDPEGFSAQRAVMIVIACCTLTAAFGLAGLFLNEQWAFLAFLVTATAPFVIHETYFTWPKLEAAWFLLLASYLIIRGRFFLAGLLWGIGYLCHPLVLLFAPALLAIVFLRLPKSASTFGTLSGWLKRAASLLPGLALCTLLWVLANRNRFSQSSFLSYPYMIDGGGFSNLSAWLRSRWDSVANTLIPLYLFFLHADHHSINSVYKPSPPVVRFYFQYWNTLPFGVGIAYFFCMLRLLAKSVRQAPAWLLLVFALPFACFSVYWGAGNSGMLREGLHPWVLGLLIFSVVIWQKIAAHQAFSAACSIALLFRGIEMLLMLLLPTILTNQAVVSQQFALSDALVLCLMLASAAWLCLLTVRQASFLCGLNQKPNGSPANLAHMAMAR